ncbi:MAG: 5-(carboxyamino)imidazole ribonucleotide synthase [Nannocystaceae bacterium]
MSAATDRAPLEPGATLGVLGGGQLGRMFTLAARSMGYRVHSYSPAAQSPAGQVADREWVFAYEDADALRRFSEAVDAVTIEFENVPVATLEALAERVPVRPGSRVLAVAQNRLAEKTFLEGQGFPVTSFRRARGPDDVARALAELGGDAILKTAGAGYDGKGQARIEDADAAAAAWATLGLGPAGEAIVEAFVPFDREVSVVVARGVSGAVVPFDVFENHHERHILDVTCCPAGIAPALAERAVELACEVLVALDVVGVLCVEFFVGPGDALRINEIAPRPHNSGHLTIDACATSQFEQQVRVLCGLPPGSSRLLTPAAMVNLLGDLWSEGTPRWAAALARDVKLHLYGKAEARPGRKMGHLTALATTVAEARARALQARRALVEPGV